MINNVKSLFFTIIKSRLNEKEFKALNEITALLLNLITTLAFVYIGLFSMMWIFEDTQMKNYPNIFLALIICAFIILAYKLVKGEIKEDYNEVAFVQLLEFNDFIQKAGLSKEVVTMMKIPVHLSLVAISDMQREIGDLTSPLPHEFFSSIRKIVKGIGNKIFYNNPF